MKIAGTRLSCSQDRCNKPENRKVSKINRKVPKVIFPSIILTYCITAKWAAESASFYKFEDISPETVFKANF